ncbi:MAG: hypothetical protein JST19_04165 [Bacteroidetes bacterium]|nr:hypothetical protein [Bacteroidota bacterium]
MKRISLGVLALLLAGTTAFANGPVAKRDTTQKKECTGQCRKNIKTGTCKDKATCSDMNSCRNKCS